MGDTSLNTQGHADSSGNEHAERIAAFSASYAQSHVNAYSRDTRSGYFYMRRLDLVDAILQELPTGGSVLDIGCGAGHASALVARHGYSYVGADLSPEMLEQARAAQFNPRAQFVLASVEDLPFPPASFNIVLALGVLEYVCPEALPDAMNSIARVLRPGGSLIASLLNRDCPVWVTRAARETASAAKARLHRRQPADRSPETLFHPRLTRRLVEDSGLVLVETVGYSFAIVPEKVFRWHPQLWAYLARRLEGLGRTRVRAAGMASIVVATAPTS